MTGVVRAVAELPAATELLDLLDSAVILLDRGGRIERMNAAAEQCIAAGRDRALGRPLADVTFLPPEVRAALRQPPRDGSGLRLHEIALAGGQFDCTLKTTRDGGLLLELHDLEWEHRRTRLQQRELQTGLLDLLGRNLGHEIRNPLGGIRGAAQMLAAELAAPDMAQLARLIMREADRIDELLHSLGQPRFANEPFDLYPVLDEAIGLLKAEFGARVAFNRDFDPSIPPILGDAAAIRRVLLNLLRNACEARSRRVELRTRIEHGGALLQATRAGVLRLDVTDDGEGVPDSLRGLLFLPMVTGKRGGTGLGLALSQQIAAAHGGLICYEPAGAGGSTGSRFSLYLPLERQSPAPHRERGT